jgi:hypothetical protein
MSDTLKRSAQTVYKVTTDSCRYDEIRRTFDAALLLSDGKEMGIERCCNVEFWKGFCHFRLICLVKTTNEASALHVKLCSTNHQRGIGLQLWNVGGS